MPRRGGAPAKFCRSPSRNAHCKAAFRCVTGFAMSLPGLAYHETPVVAVALIVPRLSCVSWLPRESVAGLTSPSSPQTALVLPRAPTRCKAFALTRVPLCVHFLSFVSQSPVAPYETRAEESDSKAVGLILCLQNLIAAAATKLSRG